MAKKTRNIQVIKDLDGNNIVIINDLIFKGKKRVNWKDVETYLRKYVGEFYEIAKTGDIVYIGKDLPREYTHSKYTKSLIRRTARNKANLIQAIPELIEIATNKSFKVNQKLRNQKKAMNGWYKYNTRFALPIFNGDDEITSYNIFKAILIIRINENNKLYLYDIIQIFKE